MERFLSIHDRFHQQQRDDVCYDDSSIFGGDRMLQETPGLLNQRRHKMRSVPR